MKNQEFVSGLFQEYRDKCYGFFVKLLGGNSEVAKDLTQDVFLSLLRKGDDLEEVEDWDNYIYTMCLNRAYDHLKKAANDKKYREYIFWYWNHSTNLLQSNSVEKRMESAYYEELLEKGLKNLPDQQRLIFNLSKREGLSHQKIAEKLNISPLTVRNHLHRAVKSIRSNTHPDLELMIVTVSYWLLLIG